MITLCPVVELLSHLRDGEQRRPRPAGRAGLLSHLRDGELFSRHEPEND